MRQPRGKETTRAGVEKFVPGWSPRKRRPGPCPPTGCRGTVIPDCAERVRFSRWARFPPLSPSLAGDDAPNTFLECLP